MKTSVKNVAQEFQPKFHEISQIKFVPRLLTAQHITIIQFHPLNVFSPLFPFTHALEFIKDRSRFIFSVHQPLQHLLDVYFAAPTYIATSPGLSFFQIINNRILTTGGRREESKIVSTSSKNLTLFDHQPPTPTTSPFRASFSELNNQGR